MKATRVCNKKLKDCKIISFEQRFRQMGTDHKVSFSDFQQTSLAADLAALDPRFI